MNPTPPHQFQNHQPLYPHILFNRPVTRRAAGRLLVIGGHSQNFSLPTAIHQLAYASGVGECTVALPDSLLHLLGGSPGAIFVPSSPSGSLGRAALDRLLTLTQDADATAIGASLSNNSETAILTEQLLRHLTAPTVVFDEAFTALQYNLRLLTDRPDTLIIATMPQIFKLTGALELPIHIRPGGGLMNKLEIVHAVAQASQAHYLVYGTEIITTAGQDDLIVTPITFRAALTPALFYAVASTFWLQNPNARHQALATASYVIQQTTTAFTNPQSRPTIPELAGILRKLTTQDNF